MITELCQHFHIKKNSNAQPKEFDSSRKMRGNSKVVSSRGETTTATAPKLVIPL
jgi:hypothetical protein